MVSAWVTAWNPYKKVKKRERGRKEKGRKKKVN